MTDTISDEAKHQWRSRELSRFTSGQYMDVPWCYEGWFLDSPHLGLHLVHVSLDDPTKVAFTESEDKGVRDIQTRMKPGRYLTRFYGDVLSEAEIRDWCSKMTAKFTPRAVKFTENADDVERVYTEGPRSCMSYEADSYDSHCHPARVYGEGDLAIAYIEVDDRITARAVVWPEKKVFSKVYGDEPQLDYSLKALGYSYGSISGARIGRIPEGSGFVVPYVDDCYYAEDNGSYLVLGDGSVSLKSTEGLSFERVTCDNCDAHVDEGDTVIVRYRGIHQSWCESCAEETFRCQCCEENYPDGDCTMVGGEAWCDDCAGRHAFNCGHCDAMLPDSENVCSDTDGLDVCRACSHNLEETPCGELARNENDCDCRTCENSRANEEREEAQEELDTRTAWREREAAQTGPRQRPLPNGLTPLWRLDIDDAA